MSEDIKNPEPPVDTPLEPAAVVHSDTPEDTPPKNKKTRKYTRRKKTEPKLSDPVVTEPSTQEPVDLPSNVEPEPSLQYVSGGKPLPILRTMLAGTLVLVLAMIYLFGQFKGFNSATAMDQAQIARQLAQGNGFSTKFIRPLAIWQLEKVGKPVPSDNFPDFFQSPLNPLINALPLKLIESSWKLTPIDLIYPGDRMIAGVSVLCFVLALLVWFFVGARLFDYTTSLLSCGTVLLTDLLWQFSLSGLPQMLMLLLFGGGVWFTLVAMEREGRRVWIPLTLAGVLFALMILAHGAAAWMFLAWMVFVVWHGKPRWMALLTCLAVLLVTLGPWLYRNHAVCGNALGLGIYEMVAPSETAESGYMRNLSSPPSFSKAPILLRIKKAVLSQTGDLWAFLGMNIAAGLFFLSLVHRFESFQARRIRLLALILWLGAFWGMLLCGVGGPVSSNQLHVLFTPVFAIFGMAFLLDLWSRLEIPHIRWKAAFLGAVLFLCGFPMLLTIAGGPGSATQWPPYVPPFIAILGYWYEEKEVVCSDMPWAVAWYAQRKCLLLPETIKQFNRISDYNVLGESVKGLYLTPVTGNRALFADIYQGPFTDWVFLITRPPDVTGFSLPVFTPMPIEGGCILFSDCDRWSRRD